jgi:hypothetical protein
MTKVAEPSPRQSWRRTSVIVALSAVTVGAVVTAAAALSGVGVCGAPVLDPDLPAGPPDDVCVHLVRTLAERVGLATAALTVIITLTFIGLSRLADERRSEVPDRAASS